MRVDVRIPGKIMLAGEYAVLQGGTALAAAVGLHLNVRVTADNSSLGARGVCRVRSDHWSTPRLVRASDEINPGEALLDVVHYAMVKFGADQLDIDVRSDLAIAFGIGSSSALRLGVLVGIAIAVGKLRALPYDQVDPELRESYWHLARTAWLRQKLAQGQASGYDVATQMMGGLVRFEAPHAGPPEIWPTRAERVASQEPLSSLIRIFVGRQGAATGPLVASTWQWLKASGRSHRLRDENESLIKAFLMAIERPHEPSVRHLLVQQVASWRSLFAGSPYASPAPFAAVRAISGFDQTWTMKPTGAGGDDALLVIGEMPPTVAAALAELGWTPLDADLAASGLHAAVSA